MGTGHHKDDAHFNANFNIQAHTRTQFLACTVTNWKEYNRDASATSAINIRQSLLFGEGGRNNATAGHQEHNQATKNHGAGVEWVCGECVGGEGGYVEDTQGKGRRVFKHTRTNNSHIAKKKKKNARTQEEYAPVP